MSAIAYRDMVHGMEQRGGPIDRDVTRFWKTGPMGIGDETVTNAWTRLNNPRREIFKNCRFCFTEAGWRRYGRPTVAACQQTGQTYRVISLKERSVEVAYRDELQVAVRPKKKSRTAPDSS